MQWERKKTCILFRKRFQKIALEYNPNFNVTLITKNSNTLMSVIMVKIVASSTTNRRFGIDPNDLAQMSGISC